MEKQLLLLLWIAIMLSCFQCLSHGNEQLIKKNIHDENLVIGKSEVQKILKSFGEPNYNDTVTKDGVKVDRYFWLYYNLDTKKYKEIWIESIDGILINYYFISSFENDLTKYDIKKFNLIKVGMDVNKVIEILGKPNGQGEMKINKNDNPYNFNGDKYYNMVYMSPENIYQKINKQGPKQTIVTRTILRILYDTRNKVIKIENLILE